MPRKKVLKKEPKPVKKKIPEYRGHEVEMIDKKPNCSKHISVDGNDIPNGQIMYHCRFKDGSFKMISEEAYKNLTK